jgi:subtilisin family serine protease
MRRAPWILLLLVLCLAPALQLAPTQAVIAAQPQQHYIVQLAGQAIAVASDSLGQAKNSKLNSQAPAIKHYKNALAQSRRSSLQQIQQLLGHTPPILASYDTVFHGVLLELSAQEAQQIKQIPSVLKVYRDQAHQLSSDSGPRLIGANSIHQASTTGFFAATLLAQNLAIPTNSTLTGRAQLRLDPNSQQLQINIQLNGSAGTAQLIRLHDSSILASLPSNNSNSYQNSITLSTSDQNLLHHDGLFLRINTAQHPNGAIGGVVSGYRGEGVVIGVIDSGINMQHPSFAEIGGDGYRHLNPNGQGNFLGACNPSNPYHHPSIICNNKLIGAWTFERNAAVRNPANNAPSPHDDNGHGSHTASTAAGNILYNLDYDGVHYAQIAGVAPHANIIAYDVCGYYQNGNYTSNCLSSSILAAIEQATLDGVDVINHSISGGTDPWNNPIEQAFLAARQAGIVVSAAAGNNGPLAGSVNHISPWLLSVAASTHDRSYSKELLNIKSASTNYGSITGVGRSATIDNNTTIIYAADISPANTTCDSFDNSQASQIAGKIVLCDYGNNSQFAKAQNALQAGAAGLIIANNSSQGDTLIDIDYPLPSIQISYNHGQQLKAWLNQGQTLSAQINATHNSIKPSNADRMGYFSAQGPSQAPYQNLLKPDLSAPGVAILAASAHSNSASIDLMQSNGTSMAAPHVAGAAALLIGLHPDWSAGEIQSALMLSATPALQNYNSGPANAFARGSGRIQIDQAAAAGLVLDETIEQFQQANPAQGGDPRNLNLANLIDSQCAGACSWVRTFRNTRDSTIHWQVSSSDPALSITPSSFSIAGNSSQTLSFSFDVSAKTLGSYHFAQVTLSSSDSQVPDIQLPVVVQASKHNIAAQYTYHQNSGQSNFSYPISIATEQPLSIEELGMVRANQYTNSLTEGQKTVFSVFASNPIARFVVEIASTTAHDLDLKIYLDNNNNGNIESHIDTLICTSDSSHSHEYCSELNKPAGRYLIEIENISASASAGDSFVLNWALIDNDQHNFSVQLSADPNTSGSYTLSHQFNLNSQAGDTWYGLYTLRNSNDSSLFSRSTIDYYHSSGAPEQLHINSGNHQQTTVANNVAIPLQVTLSDQFGNPISGQTITFTAPTSGPSASFIGSNSSISDANGRAQVQLIANTIAGSYNIIAKANSGISTSFTLTNLAASPSQLAIVSGNQQQTRINSQFAQPIQIRISDKYNNPIAGQLVAFNAPTSGPSAILIGTNPALSDSQGIVSISARANNNVGSYTIRISSGDLSADLTLTNTSSAQAPDTGKIYLPMVTR